MIYKLYYSFIRSIINNKNSSVIVFLSDKKGKRLLTPN